MKTVKTYHDLVLILILSIISFVTNAQPEESLNNSKIIELSQQGLSASILINKIQSSKCTFDLRTDSLLFLKQQNIPDEVINAMLSIQNAVETVDSNDPKVKHEAGIYFLDETKALVLLEPSVCSQGKSGGYLASTFSRGWAASTMKATLDGNTSRTIIKNSRAEFYFYFDKTNSELGGNWYMHNATSPKEFILVKPAVRKKTREFVIASSANYGSSMGVPEKFKKEFSIEKLSTGIYKVMFNYDLPPGEYFFMYAGSQAPVGTGQKVYDFSIQ